MALIKPTRWRTPQYSDHYGGTAVATRWPHTTLEVLDMRVAGAADVPWCTVAVTVPIPDTGELLFIGSWHQHHNAYCQVRSAATAFDQPIDGVWASDHYGVVVDVDIGVDATDR